MRPFLATLALVGLVFCLGCGGNSSSSSTNGNGTGSSAGSSNPGNSGGNGGGSNGIRAATYLYVANHGAGTITPYRLNSDGTLAAAGSPVDSPNVHWLAVLGNHYLIAAEDETSSRLELFQIAQADGTIKSMGTVAMQSPPTGVTTDESKSVVYSSSKNGIYAFSVSGSGFAPLAGSPYFTNPAGQDPRSDRWAMSVLADPSGKYLFAGFEGYHGSGSVEAIARDASGALTTENLALATDPESLAAFWAGSILYDADPVLGFTVGVSGSLSPIAGGPNVAGTRLASDPAGHILLATDPNLPNQGRIHVYHIAQSNGFATEVAGSPFPSQGIGPSIVRVDPSGTFAVVANGDNTVTSSPSNNVVVFRFDGSSGMLMPAGSPVSTGSLPTDVAFAITSGS